MKYKRKITFILCFVGICLINLYASEPIILEYSDALIGEQDSVTNVRRLAGNVRLRQGNVRITCDNAIQYIGLNKYDLIGNVVIKQNTITLKSPTIHYDGNTYIATAKNGVKITDKETQLTAEYGTYSTQTLIANFAGNVVVEDDSTIIYSDFVTHNRNNRVSNAWGNVLIIGKYTNAKLAGDSVVNVPMQNLSEVYGNPKLLQIDSSGADSRDTLFISANKMEAIREADNERYLARGNVEVIRNNLQARAENTIYYKAKDIIFLEEFPILWYDSTQLFADTIIVQLENNKLRRIDAVSSAFSVSQNDTMNAARKDQMSGKIITIEFESDSLRQIVAEGNARSLYFIETDGQPDGLISVSADAITIEIVDKKAENIIMINNVPGEYLPQPLIVDEETKYYLPGFRFSQDRPQRIDYSIFEVNTRNKRKEEK
ncbi:MAG TPA: OstA-like protein [Candidatus Kapabacteria bacterium]|jgi:lipopolysaccharide export system protein LptA|nr:OstA-like protein [Candidatus Kapabacteria bacterium]